MALTNSWWEISNILRSKSRENIENFWEVFLYYWFDQGQFLLWSKGKNEIIGPELLFEKNRIDNQQL